MKRMRPFIVAAALAGAACAISMTSPLRAEPIPGSDLPAYSDVPPQARELNEAVAKFKEGDFDGALLQLKKAAEKDADLPPAEVVLAQLYFREGRLKEGKESLETAAKESPDDPEAFLLLAGAALHEGDAVEAERLYEKAGSLTTAFEKSPKRKKSLQPRIHAGLASVARANKDWPAAQKSIEAWLQLDPKNPSAMLQLANCMFQRKNAEGALNQLREAKKLVADMIAPEVILAQLYQQAGDRSNAKKWLVAALSASPKDERTHLAAGQAALDFGEINEAVKHAIAAVRFNPKSSDAQFFRGVVALFQKDFVTAETYLEMAAKQLPDNFGISNNLALALIELDDEEKSDRAMKLAKANWMNYPKIAESNATYGWVLYRRGRLDDAEKSLRAAAELESDNGDIAYYLARLLVGRGGKPEARRLLEAAIPSKKPFLYRQEAEELLEQLKK